MRIYFATINFYLYKILIIRGNWKQNLEILHLQNILIKINVKILRKTRKTNFMNTSIYKYILMLGMKIFTLKRYIFLLRFYLRQVTWIHTYSSIKDYRCHVSSANILRIFFLCVKKYKWSLHTTTDHTNIDVFLGD